MAKKTNEQLFSEFIGCILFGRIPLVIQRPSVKVHNIIFEKRMLELKEKISPSLCICELEDSKKYKPYFNCDSIPESDPSDKRPVHFSTPDSVAFLQMSSGTTGISKICKITHKQVISHCEEYAKTIGLDYSKTVVSWLPLYHDMGLIATFLLPIITGAKFHIIDPFDWLINPETILRMVDKYKGTHVWMPNFAFNHLCNKINTEEIKDIDLSSLERMISCSEPTFFDDLHKFETKFSSLGLKSRVLSVCYALAENIFAVSQSDNLAETEWKGRNYVNCGKVIPGVSVIIMRNNKDVTEEDDGTVMLRSSYEPITNIRSSFFSYYNTGDIGFLEDGNLYIIGREKDMFASYGVNIYPEMIEHLIANVDGVISGRVVCFGVFDKVLGTNRVIALAESNNTENNVLRTHLSTMIKEEFNLTAIVKLVESDSLIKTSSGKFCRVKNKELYG